LVLPLAVAAACGSDHVRLASEVVEVVGGEPTVGQGLPHVSRGDGGMDASFGPAAPFQVDTFSQEQVQKVDILWVIDDGAGMRATERISASSGADFARKPCHSGSFITFPRTSAR